MKLVNVASLDPKMLTSTGRSGLQNASSQDRQMWEEMQEDCHQFAIDAERAAREIGLKEQAPDTQPEEDISSNLGPLRTSWWKQPHALARGFSEWR